MIRSISVALLTIVAVYFMVAIFFAGLEYNPLDWSFYPAVFFGLFGGVGGSILGVIDYKED